MQRPVCYQGDEGYIFVSYAHRDSERVWPIISQMQKDGYRVWYDDGIDPGTEWDENIAAHVTGCGYFIAFLSENYLASNNCKDELNFSRDQGKPQLLIYLEDVELPSGMAMRLGRNQAIFCSQCEGNAFYEKLYEAQDIGFFHGSRKAPKQKVSPKLTSQTFRTKKKVSIWPIVAAIVLIAAAVAANFLWPKQEPEAPPEETAPEVTEAPAEMKPVTNVVLAETSELKLTALQTELDSRYFILSLSVENTGRADVNLYTDNVYLNGVRCEPEWSGFVSAGEESVVDLHWDRNLMERYGIDPETVTMIECSLRGTYEDASGDMDKVSFVYYPYGEENKTLLTYTPDEDDVVLLDTEDFFAAATDSRLTEDGAWIQEVVCINRSAENMIFSVRNETINNYHTQTNWSSWIAPERIVYGEITFGANQWETTGYDRVLCYRGEWSIFNSSYNFSEEITYPFVHYPEGESAAAALMPRQLTQEEVLFENEYIIAGYLGCRNISLTDTDMIYVCNPSNHELEFMINVFAGTDSGYGCYNMAPGDEAVILCYRSQTNPGTATVDFFWDTPDGSRNFETMEIELQDPETE